MFLSFCIIFLNDVFLIHSKCPFLESLDPADVILRYWLYCYSIQGQHLLLQDYIFHVVFQQFN